MIDHYKKLIFLLTSKEKKALFLLSLILTFGMFLEVLGLGILIPLITLILSPEEFNSFLDNRYLISFQSLPYDRKVLYSLIGIALVYIIKACFQVIITYNQNLISEKIGANLANRLYKKYLYQDYIKHINGNLSEIIKNTQTEINYFMSYCRSILIFFVEFTLALSIMITIVLIEPIGAIIVGVFFIILSTIYFTFTKKINAELGKEREGYDSRLSKIVLDSLSGIKDVKLLMKERYFDTLHLKYTNKKIRISSNYMTFSSIPRIYLELIAVFGLILFILILFYNDNTSNEIITTLGIFIAATFRMIPSLNRMLSSLQSLKYYESSLGIIYNEFKNENYSELVERTFTFIKLNRSIEIKNLNFCYDKTKILNSINLKINIGETIGIKGLSGSGKSTLIDLINGLLKPTSGHILIDGVDINNSINDWKKSIGYVGQEIFLLDDTILNNIALGVEKNEIDNNKVNYVVKLAQLDEFLYDLELGIETKIGDRGIQLSGGQRQRIAIARALYNNPELLIFDEATASLDSKTERELMKSIYNLKGEKTIIMIAHRLTTLKNCDKIFEIKNGNLTPIKKETFLKSISND